MLTLTDAAQKELEGFFADREKATVRIYLAPAAAPARALLWRWTKPVRTIPGSNRAVLPSASTMNFCSR